MFLFSSKKSSLVGRNHTPLIRRSRLVRSSNDGFSMIEVLITAAIIGVVTGLVTLRYGSFNNLILLKNQAYQIAIELRETQTKALSVFGSGSEFRLPYGIYFSTANRNEYIIFQDTNESGNYNVGEGLEVRSLDSRFLINRLCSGANCSLGELSITFRRPNFDALMNNGAITDGQIEIATTDGSNTRFVHINAAGQITVE